MEKRKYIRIDSIFKRQESIKHEISTLLESKSSFNKRTKTKLETLEDKVKIDGELINTYSNNYTLGHKEIDDETIKKITEIDKLIDENTNTLINILQEIDMIITNNKKERNKLHKNNTPTTIDLKLIATKIKLARQIYNECIGISSTHTHIEIIYDLLNYFEKITKIITKNMIGNKIANHDEQRRMVESYIQTEIDKLNQIVETYEDESSNEDYANDE